MVGLEIGAFSFIDSPPLIETLSLSGLDWLCLDAQHGRWSDVSVLAALDQLGAAATGRPDPDGTRRARVLVRPRSADSGLIGRALDAGAAGVIVPMITGLDEARRVVAASRYPPSGHRSFGPIRSPYGDPDDLAAANDGITVAIMIETRGALDAVDEIAALEGVDIIFVGPFDLSLALGISVDDLVADVTESSPLSRVARAAKSAGKTFGAFAGAPVMAGQLARRGAEFISIFSDTDAVSRGVESLRESFTRRVAEDPAG